MTDTTAPVQTSEERLAEFIAKGIKDSPIEAKIIKRIYKALAKAGNPIVSVWDGEDDNAVSSLQEVYTQVFNLDEAHLYTQSGAYVFVVMGQDWDTVADYNVSLEDTLKPVNDWIMEKMD